jgi:hypothetical protein
MRTPPIRQNSQNRGESRNSPFGRNDKCGLQQSLKHAFSRKLAQGPVDILVNNGATERTGAMEETPLVDFRTALRQTILAPSKRVA